MTDTITTKPFASQAQQRWAHATGQSFARRWDSVTDFSTLPKRVKRLLTRRKALAEAVTKAWSPQARAAALAARRRNMLARQGQVLPDADARNLASARREAARLGKVHHTPVAKLPKAPKGGGKKGGGGKGKTPEQLAKAQQREHERMARDMARSADQAKRESARQQRDFARQQRRMEQVARQQAAAQRKADIAARRAKLQQKRGGGGKHSGPASAAEQRAALRFQQSQDDRQARIDRQARLDAEHEADRQLRLQRQQQGGREAPVGKPRNNVVTSGAGTNRAVRKAASDPGDYLVVEDPKKPTTWHLQVKRGGTPDHGLMGSAWAALHSGFRGNTYQGPNKDAAIAKLKKLYQSEGMEVPAQKDASFAVYKDARGNYRWVMLSSNAFRDRDGEIVSTKALGDDVARADADRTYGPLRWWHMGVPFGPGVDLGTCDFNAMVGKMLIESGTFASPAIGQAIAQKADQLQGSIGFTHPADEPDRGGVFWHIHRFERSLVPRGKAANPYTTLYVQETPMNETDQAKIKQLADMLKDKGLLESLLEQVQTKEKSLEAAGVAFKSEEPAPEPAATKDDGDMAVTEDALPPDGEPEGDEGGMEPDGDENMLTMAECQQIAQMTAQAVIEQLMPHLDIGKKMDEVKGMLGGVAGAYAKKDAEQAALKEQLATLTARLKELEGDQPKGGGYRASLDTATVVTKETPAPAADPLNDFIGGFVLGGAQPAAR